MSELAFVLTASHIYSRKPGLIIPGFYKVVGKVTIARTRQHYWERPVRQNNILNDYYRYAGNVRTNELISSTHHDLEGVFIELNTTKFGYPFSKLGNPFGKREFTEELTGRGRRFMYVSTSRMIPLFPMDMDNRTLNHIITRKINVGPMGRLFPSLSYFPILKEYLDGKITVDPSLETFCVPQIEYGYYDRVVRGQIVGPLAGVKGRTPEVSEGFVIDRTTGLVSRKQPEPEPVPAGHVRYSLKGVGEPPYPRY